MSEGLCECECGRTTPIYKRSYPQKGLVQGEHARFCVGHKTPGLKPHNWKGGTINTGGYVELRERERRILEHRAIAEKAIGKPLPPRAVVHHHGGVKVDNNKNLVLCQDHSYHMLLHVRTRALKACGNTSYRKCPYCKQYDDPSKMKSRKTAGESQYFHADCRNSYRRTCKENQRREECQQLPA